ncbi:MAG TPA: GtrA family protein [Rhizomicrobium sp.]|nr:GtrA family protein [Rhizomicrobium sp.]
MPAPQTTLSRYIAFAAAASLANLGAQRGFLAVYDGPFAVTAAIVLGTGIGLVLKFLLDKFWIFEDRAERHWVDHGRQFGLYTLSGGVTTAIFWGTELLAWNLTRSQPMMLLGGAVGLTFGYSLKYWLDRRFVFGR